jgi:hypothetical protein
MPRLRTAESRKKIHATIDEKLYNKLEYIAKNKKITKTRMLEELIRNCKTDE